MARKQLPSSRDDDDDDDDESSTISSLPREGSATRTSLRYASVEFDRVDDVSAFESSRFLT